jgi:hypothetical protein
MGIIDKVLATLLALAILAATGALWYADHEHGQIKPLQDKVSAAALAASQAVADRNAALDAARDAQRQASAAQAAMVAAQASATQAASEAKAAHDKLSSVAKAPDVAKTLDTPLPKAVWDAIYKPAGD